MKLTPEQLGAVLADVRERALSGDSLEGRIEWRPSERAGIYVLEGAYRTGNLDGQGGVRLLSDPTTQESEMGERNENGSAGQGEGERPDPAAQARAMLTVTREQVAQIRKEDGVGVTEATRRAKRKNIKALIATMRDHKSWSDLIVVLEFIAEEMPL